MFATTYRSYGGLLMNNHRMEQVKKDLDVFNPIQQAQGKLTDDVAMSCSRLPSLLGFNTKWSSPNQELQKSIDALDPNYRRPFKTNDAIHFGNVTEHLNLEHAAKKLKLASLDTALTTPVIHPTVNLQGSLDGIGNSDYQLICTDKEKGVICLDEDNNIVDSLAISGLGILEAKLTSAYPTDKPDPARGPIQIQGLMMCTGHTWGAVAILYQGIHHKVYVYKENKNIHSLIANEIKEFDSRINTYKEGVVDWYPLFSPNEGAAVYRLDKGLPSIKLNFQDEANIEAYLDAGLAVNAAKKLKDKALQAVMDTLGNHEKGVGANYAVTWGMTKGRKGYTVEDSKPSRAKSIKVKEINR